MHGATPCKKDWTNNMPHRGVCFLTLFNSRSCVSFILRSCPSNLDHVLQNMNTVQQVPAALLGLHWGSPWIVQQFGACIWHLKDTQNCSNHLIQWGWSSTRHCLLAQHLIDDCTNPPQCITIALFTTSVYPPVPQSICCFTLPAVLKH